MAVTIVQGEETLATTTLGSGQSASVTFTPQEGVIEVTAFAFDASPSPTRPRRPGQPGSGGGKIDPNPEDGGDGVGIPPMRQQSEVTARWSRRAPPRRPGPSGSRSRTWQATTRSSPWSWASGPSRRASRGSASSATAAPSRPRCPAGCGS